VIKNPGATVRAQREPDEEFESAVVKGTDTTKGTISLRFADG